MLQQRTLDFGLADERIAHAQFFGREAKETDDRWTWFSIVQKDQQRYVERNGKRYPVTRQRSYPLHQLPEIVGSVDPRLNSYITQNEFERPDRRTVHLWSLNCLWLDIDTYKTDWGLTRTLEAQVDDLLWILADMGYPSPSIGIYSGRGIYMKWLHDPIPRAALPRWNAVMREITQKTIEFGSDMAAKDASRVLRMPGTVNSRSGETARIVHIEDDGHGFPVRYSFDYLAECMLPKDREAIRQEKLERMAKRLTLKKVQPDFRRGERTGNLLPLSAQKLSWDRVEDLRLLVKLRKAKDPHRGIEGYRELMLFWQMNHLLLSGQVDLSRFWPESRSLADELDPVWATEDGKNNLSSLFARAKRYWDGEKVEFNGRTYKGLYTPKNQTLIDVFHITPDEERLLRTIVSEGEARRRRLERDRARKSEQRLAMGMKAHLSAEEKRRIVESVLAGESLRSVAARTGVSKSAISKWKAEFSA